MVYRLHCKESGNGDSGSRCDILDPDENYHPIPGETRPRVGCGVRVGAMGGRTYANQDWWQTTPITEILIDKPKYMKFKTRNSVYEWHCD